MSGCHGVLTGEVPVVACLSFGRGNVGGGLQQPAMLEPGQPLEGGQYRCVLGVPGDPLVAQLNRSRPVDRPSQGVVIAIALAALGRFHPWLGQALGVAERNSLGDSVRMSGQGLGPFGLPGLQCPPKSFSRGLGLHQRR